eukprot:TRINITY_DN27227_c0_g1_i1.p2 TRINITY_DN27227_c0_g1~~TRINITY_DN27227_c0_g1_i1.p2  ORF type:complete len:101 (-),score=12.54 TRINITY_DN27227_c0_g1_i1:52-354(-)
MCIRDSSPPVRALGGPRRILQPTRKDIDRELRTVRDGGHLRKHHVPLVKTLSPERIHTMKTVSYTHLRAHETPEHLVCRLLLEKKNKCTRERVRIGYRRR